MSNKIYLPNGMEAYQAVYNQFPIEEYNNNPFIQALPPPCDKKSIIKNMMINPNFNEEEKELDSAFRLDIIQRLYKVFQPLPIHIKIWSMISTLLRQGYLARNPFDRDYKRYVNETGKQIINRTFEINSNSNFRTTASCGTIIGISGVGKTTTVNRILSNIPQIIVHNEYNNQHFNQIQLTWLKLETPYNASLKALSLQFFMKIDELLGGDNFKKYVSRNLSTDAMIPLMGKLANNVGLGLLVLDELQNLRNGKITQMMNYFVSLINSFGVPIVYIGTPASYDLLENEFRIARRFTGYGEVIWNSMDDNQEFRLFMNGIWKYQWTKKFAPLTEEILNIIYEETQGISDLICKLFVNAQYMAISSGKEEVSAQILKKVAKENFKFMKKMINAIKSGNHYKIQQFEDIKRIESNETYEPKKDINIQESRSEKSESITKSINSKENPNTNINQKSFSKEFKENDLRYLISKDIDKSHYEVLKNNGYIDDLSFLLQGDII